MPIPTATGDFAAFFPMLFGSIRAVMNPGDQLNQYVRPTASQLASWRAVFQSSSPATGTRRTCKPR